MVQGVGFEPEEVRGTSEFTLNVQIHIVALLKLLDLANC